MTKRIILPRFEEIKRYHGNIPENNDNSWSFDTVKDLSNLPHEKFENNLLGCFLFKNDNIYVLGTANLMNPEDLDAATINFHNVQQIMKHQGIRWGSQTIRTAIYNETGKSMTDYDASKYISNMNYVSKELINQAKKIGVPNELLIKNQKVSELEGMTQSEINKEYKGKIENLLTDLQDRGLEGMLIHNHPFLLWDYMTPEEIEQSKNESRNPSPQDKYMMSQFNKYKIGMLATPEKEMDIFQINSGNFQGFQFGEKIEKIPVRISTQNDRKYFDEIYEKLK